MNADFENRVLKGMEYLSKFIDESSDLLAQLDLRQDKSGFETLKGSVDFNLQCMEQIIDGIKCDLEQGGKND